MRHFLLLLVLGSIVLGASSKIALAAGDRLRITNGDWPPYLSPDLPHYGIATRIVTEAFAEVGIEVDYGFFPWNRAFYLAEKGEWDGTAVWLKNQERQKLFYYSDPVVKSGYVFFHRKDMDFEWENRGDLKGLTVGTTQQYDYGPAFRKAEEEGLIRVESASRDLLNFKMLLRKRIDLFPIDRVVGLTMLYKHFTPEQIKQIDHHPRLLRGDQLHLLLSRAIPENRKRIKLFNEGLQRLRARDRVEEILMEGLNTLLDEVQKGEITD